MQQQVRALGVVIASLLAVGCTVQGNAKYTGGGSLNSAGGEGKAIFTVNADTCAGNENARGRVKYADRSAIDFENVGGVKLTAQIQKAGICAQDADESSLDPDDSECICEGWPAVVGTYVSDNPAAAGEGKFRACFASTREYEIGGADQNVVLVNDISLVGGPYDGYFNHGTMSGNIKTHACPAAEG
jgi:hypothetical protein